MTSYFSDREKALATKNKKAVAPFPINALVEISNGCNHKCLFCYNTLMERRAGKLSKEAYQSFIAKAVSVGLKEVGLYTTGEPFINNDLDWYIHTAKSHGVNRVYITSNGALATREEVERCLKAGLDSIKFSVNAADAASYKLVHGEDDWQLVLDNIADIYSLKTSKYPDLQLLGSCIMTTVTGDIKDKHSSIFSKYFDDTLYIYAGNQGGRNAHHVQKFSPGVTLTSLEDIKPCEMLWNRWHLTCEGYLTSCCVDYEHDLVYADLAHQDPLEAWNNSIIQDLRERHLTKQLQGTICHNCLTGSQASYKPISEISTHRTTGIRSTKLNDYLERIENL